MDQIKETVVMIPFMAQGHIIPFLALALQLEQRNHFSIIFVNTPQNVRKVRSSLPPTSSIQFLEIPFNSSDYGFPPNVENTDSLPYNLILKFIESSLALKPTFRKLISDLVIKEQSNSAPLCLITDMFFSWCADLAQEFGLFHAIFVGGGGFGFACFYSLWLNLPHRKTNSDEFTLPDFREAKKLHVTQLPDFLRNADENYWYAIYLKKILPQWSKADGILFNTVEEIDKLGLMYFRRKLGKPIWAIGPVLLPSGSRNRAGKEAGIMTKVCKNWLDTKPLNSVLYISFGSQNTISAQNIMQLAMALEATRINFIWVVRPPLGFDINSEFRAKEWLPEGFEERIKESQRGLLVHKWAPQVEILSHKSLSAFLSHCGWNSVVESLSHGVLLLGWPMAAEQFYNVKHLEEEIRVCVEVFRGKTCEMKHEDIAEKIELVMNETAKGKEMRKKASEVRNIIEEALKDEEGFKGSSVKAIDEFWDDALLMKRKKEQNQHSSSVHSSLTNGNHFLAENGPKSHTEPVS